MQDFLNFLDSSYTAFQAVENAEDLLLKAGFKKLFEHEDWEIKEGGKYFVTRGGSAIIAFCVNKGDYFKIIASHTDSPCLKLKENPTLSQEKLLKLNVETYGGGLWYSFFDRPLKIAGRIVREEAVETGPALTSSNFVSDFTLTIPSLAVHMQRDANERFAPNPQVDLLPLWGMGEKKFEEILPPSCLSFDLYLASAEKPFFSGSGNEFINSPRIDNLSSVYSSLKSLILSHAEDGICVAACLDSEEVGSSTRQGAGGDFLLATLSRISEKVGIKESGFYRAASKSFLISLDNAHSVHPNHPEKCDLTSRAVMGGGIVIKGHAGGAYTTDALSSSIVKKIFKDACVKYQCFYNRSDMRSGSTLGCISLGQVSILSADLGLAQLAMHSAVETIASEDIETLLKGLTAFYDTKLALQDTCAKLK